MPNLTFGLKQLLTNYETCNSDYILPDFYNDNGTKFS